MELSHPQAKIRLGDITVELERLGAIPADTLSREDEQSFDELTREFAEVDAHRRKLERDAALDRVRGAARTVDRVPSAVALRSERGVAFSSDGYDSDPILNPDSIEEGRFRNPWDLSEIRTYGRSKSQVGAELRARALSAIEKMSGADDGVRSAGTNIVERWDDGDSRIAKMVLATSSPEYMRAWQKCASDRKHLLTQGEQVALERAMSLTDSAGGYLVPFQLDPTVIISSNGSRNQIRQVARQVVATGDIWNGVSSGAVSWSWDAEAAEVSDDTTTFAQPTVPVYKAAGFVPISIEALEDEANVTMEVARLLAFGKDTLEAAAFATGSGSGQPTGIVTALVASSPTVIVVSAGANAFAAADVYALDNALPARFRAQSSWLGNRTTYNLIRQFDTGGGAQMWERIGADVPAELLGRAALESEDMDGTFGSGENYTLIYGDFENYVIADRVGMQVEFLPHLFHTSNNRPSGQRGWYAHYRVGADSVQDGAFRLLNIT
jgi:HK97 family phage major capsid protein